VDMLLATLDLHPNVQPRSVSDELPGIDRRQFAERHESRYARTLSECCEHGGERVCLAVENAFKKNLTNGCRASATRRHAS